jgi:hypothetical protein
MTSYITDTSIASLMQAAQSLTNCNRPSSGEHHSVRNFINYRQPLVPSEQKFIYCKEDLITLRPGREHAWLDSSMEKVLKWMRCDLIEVSFFNTSSSGMTLTNFVVYILFKSKRSSQRYGRFDFNESNKDSKLKTDGEAVYYTRERIDLLVGIIIIFMILLLLVVPVYLLLHVTIGPETTHSNAICIGILLISALLFSACLSAFTSEDHNYKA